MVALSGSIATPEMMRRDDGRPWFIHGIAFDITDIKRIEEELHEERNFVSTILDTVGALVVVLDNEGRILRFNPACELTTGYSMEEVQGKCVWDLFLSSQERQNASVPSSKCCAPICCHRTIRAIG